MYYVFRRGSCCTVYYQAAFPKAYILYGQCKSTSESSATTRIRKISYVLMKLEHRIIL